MRVSALSSFLLLLLAVSVSNAATRTWTGAGSNNRITTVANWAEGIVPDTGDDVVFPTNSAQYSVFCDLLPTQTLNSVTFEGGNYSFVGYITMLAITVNGGTQNLGPNLWVLDGPLYTAQGALLSGTFFGPHSTIYLEGPGSTYITISGSFGGSVTMNGSGTASITLATAGIYGLTVNSGTVYAHGSLSYSFGNFIVNGGIVRGSAYLLASTFKVTGGNAEYGGGNVFASSIEISNGATFDPMSCSAQFQSNFPPVLTGSILRPFTDCTVNPSAYLINNRSSNPVIGNFTNYPEGSTFVVQGRLFRITYQGGDGNDVQILAVPGSPFDFDGDRKADISVFRPSSGTWYVQNEAGFDAVPWGLPDDKIVPGDYDGDGKTDVAVYRPAEGFWYVLASSGFNRVLMPFGLASDIPVPADYDGDGKTDQAVFRPSTGQWWINRTISGLGITSVSFGMDGDLPVPGDYDGDGTADIAVFRPSTGTWFIRGSRAGDFGMQWGQAGDTVVPADYDGDGKTDIAVFRPTEGVWYLYLSSTQAPSYVFWGTTGDVPVPGDYDGDGRADVAIYRPSDGNWWIDGSTAGISVQQFGLSDDRPVPAAYVR